MSLFTAMEVSASGLAVQRTRMNAASSNLANASTTKTRAGGPYKRKDVVVVSQDIRGTNAFGRNFAAGNAVRGASVQKIQQDTSQPQMRYEPGHPHANKQGYVAYPNVNIMEEMVDMITASRAYEAGISALNTAVAIAERAIGIGGR